MKLLETRAQNLLNRCLQPVATEINELDWKAALSENTDRLAQHLCAFSNESHGGFLVFGLNNEGLPTGLTKQEGDGIIHRLGNIARHNLALPATLEHFWGQVRGIPVLIIYVHEVTDKPAYPRNGTVYDSFKRSAGQTVRMSRQEVKQVIAKSHGISFEDQIAITGLSIDDVLNTLDYDSYFQLTK